MKNVTKWATKIGPKEIQHWEERIEEAHSQVLQTALCPSTPGGVAGATRQEKRSFQIVVDGMGNQQLSEVEKGSNWSEPSKVVTVQFGNILIPSKGTGIAATFESPIKYSFTTDEMKARVREINASTIFAPW